MPCDVINVAGAEHRKRKGKPCASCVVIKKYGEGSQELAEKLAVTAGISHRSVLLRSVGLQEPASW